MNIYLYFFGEHMIQYKQELMIKYLCNSCCTAMSELMGINLCNQLLILFALNLINWFLSRKDFYYITNKKYIITKFY